MQRPVRYETFGGALSKGTLDHPNRDDKDAGRSVVGIALERTILFATGEFRDCGYARFGNVRVPP